MEENIFVAETELPLFKRHYKDKFGYYFNIFFAYLQKCFVLFKVEVVAVVLVR